MSKLSQFLGGSGVPIGSFINAQDNPIKFSQFGQEFLLSGSIVPYDASYVQSVEAAPKLSVFGNDTTTKAAAAGTSLGVNYAFISPNYYAVDSGTPQYSTTLSSWAACTAALVPSTQIKRLAVSGTFIVYSAAANSAHQYLSAATTFSSVGGTFTTHPVSTTICYGSSNWLALSSLTGATGEQSYIAAASPAGTWTIGVGTNVGMTTVGGLAYGAGVFVAVGTSASTTGKIATCATPGSAWTDRTSASGVTFGTGDNLTDVVFDGTVFIAIANTNKRVITSVDGINWVSRGTLSTSSSSTYVLSTNGAGTVIAACGTASNPISYISSDHGVTWEAWQAYAGKALVGGQARASFCNSKLLFNHSGTYQALIDLGSSPYLVTPDYVGLQVVVTQAASASTTTQLHVRTK